MDARRESEEGLESLRLRRIRADVLQSPDLPAMPVAYARLLAVVSNERSTPQDLVEVLELDPSLAARILRLANSAFLGVPGEVSSLSRAVLLLGWKWVSSLALGVTVWSSFTTRGGAPALRLWGHAARVALAARLLGRHVGLREPEVAFSAGLLHDIGRALLLLRHRHDADRIAASESEEDLERERTEYGADHALVGHWLASAWRLPETLVDTIARHHEPVGANDPIDALAVVRLADRLMREAEEERAPGACGTKDGGVLLPDPALAEAWPAIVQTVRDEGRDFERLFTGAG